MIGLVSVALAAPLTLKVPFPTQRLYERPDRVCVTVPAEASTMHPVEVDDGTFHAVCEPQGDRLSICLMLLADTWPKRVAELECETGVRPIRIVPVPAFDPAEDVWDGVVVVRRVSRVQAAFQVTTPDAPGLLAQGECGVSNGQLWLRTLPEPKRQTCTLALPDGERVVPITLVDRLRD